MTVETRTRRSLDLKELTRNTAENLLEMTELMMNLSANIVDNELPIITHYRDLENIEDIRILPKTKLFIVYVSNRNSSFVESRIRLDVVSVKIGYVKTADGDTYVVVDRLPYLYTYPPRDFSSLLFFNLNPELKQYARRILDEKGASEQVEMLMIDLDMIEKKLGDNPGLKPEDVKSIELISSASKAYSSFSLDGKIGKKFNFIEMFYESDEFKYSEGFNVCFWEEGHSVIYTLLHGNHVAELVALLKYFLRKSEIKLLNSLSKRIIREALKSYVELKIIHGISD